MAPLLRPHAAWDAARNRAARSSRAVSALPKACSREAIANAISTGSSISSADDVTFVMGRLFGGEEGRKILQDIDSHIAKLPGMEGLTIVENSLDRILGTTPARS